MSGLRYLKPQPLQEANPVEPATAAPSIAVVIPCYKVRPHILGVLSRMGPEVTRVYVVDDACPVQSGRLVEEECKDPRVQVIRNPVNLGVGGAVLNGYRHAIKDGADVIVKVDGDGQMDPALIPDFVAPILAGEADYAKGNRFFDMEALGSMPRVRLVGNALLSLLTKLSGGYWDLFDPTNGYTAIHANVARLLPFDKISNRYFFETDMLFRLNTLRAVVVDVPMEAKYGDEVSSLSISRIVGEFLFKHVRNFAKRIFYNYYLRDLSLASIELPLGLLLLTGGTAFGAYRWSVAISAGVPSSAGTVMLAALPIMMGIQFLLAFIGYDIASVPRRPIHRRSIARPSASNEIRVS
jgi:glycosyltransferase involved in cell wall biosynthesis